MAASSLLALLDDIATVLDDVAVMTKRAAGKTAGVLGDDLALNAQQVSGVRANRELPVVWAVAKGSAVNKLILVPAALAISVLVPWLITPLLMIGGAYLCYEGVEKLTHKFLHPAEDAANHAGITRALTDPKVDFVALERSKIKGAIRTDFILSAEIIVISLGTVQDADFTVQVMVVCAIAVLMTVGVYGLVAGIVKLDDGGLYLARTTAANAWGEVRRRLGNGILWFAPYLMKTLSVVGTLAMFLVGGGILLHGIPAAERLLHAVEHAAHGLPGIGGLVAFFTPALVNAVGGVIAGAVVLALVSVVKKILPGSGKAEKTTG